MDERQIAVDIVQIALGFIAVTIIVLALIWRLLSKDIRRPESARFGGLRSSIWIAIFITATFQISHIAMASFGTYSDWNIEEVVKWVSGSMWVAFLLFALFFVTRELRRKVKGIKADDSTFLADPLTIFVTWSIVMLTGSLIWSLIAVSNSIDIGVGISTGGFRWANVEFAGWATSNAASQLVGGFFGLAVAKVIELLMDSNQITTSPTDPSES